MAITYKVLGQISPAAMDETDVYTVPGSKMAVLSSITVCNTSGSARTFRIAIRPGNAALQTKHYIAYDYALDANTTVALKNGYTLAATDVVTVYASGTGVAFTVSGSEQ